MLNKVLNHASVIANENKCIVNWSSRGLTSENIGDVLNIYLFKKIFEKDIVNIRKVFNLGYPPVYSFIGSVLDNTAVKNLTILGSGFKRESSKILIKPKRVIACRGPLTRKKLLETGINVPEVYGDPAILLPQFYNPQVDKKYKMGVIPHYLDKDVEIVKSWAVNPEIKVIDVFSDKENFITQMKECDFTISSSLHGVILSHAYGIPSAWVMLSKKLAGGGFKFQDYFQSLNLRQDHINIWENSSLLEIEKQTFLPEMDQITEKLLKSFRGVEIK